MRLKHRIEGAVLAFILLWQLSASALAVGAGTAAPFSWGSLALDGTEYRVICRTGQDALGDLDAVDPYGVRDDAALYALRFAAAPAAPEDRSGTAYDESQLITPVRAYDGPVVTFVTAARSTFLTAPAVPDGEDQPDSAAELFAARAIVPTLAVRPLSDALSAAELRQLAQSGFDLLDGGTDRLSAAETDAERLRQLAAGYDGFADEGLRPRGFLYPRGTSLTPEQVGGYYTDALRLVDFSAVVQPYNAAGQDRLRLNAVPLTEDTKSAVLSALKKTNAADGWLILYIDPNTLSAQSLAEVLDAVVDSDMACLPFSQAAVARYGGVLEQDTVTLFDVADAPVALDVGGLTVTNYNAAYTTPAGTRFTLFPQDGAVKLALAGVLAEDLTVSPLEDVAEEVTVTSTVSGALRYADAYRWVVRDENDNEVTLAGLPHSAGYELASDKIWTAVDTNGQSLDAVTIDLSVTNTYAEDQTLKLAFSYVTGLALDDTQITYEVLDTTTGTGSLTFDRQTMTLKVPAETAGAVLRVTVPVSAISGAPTGETPTASETSGEGTTSQPASGSPSAAAGSPSAATNGLSAAASAASGASGQVASGSPSAAAGSPSAATNGTSAAAGSLSAASGEAASGSPSAAAGSPSAVSGSPSAAAGSPSAATNGPSAAASAASGQPATGEATIGEGSTSAAEETVLTLTVTHLTTAQEVTV